jgi:hypothetical protein
MKPLSIETPPRECEQIHDLRIDRYQLGEAYIVRIWRGKAQRPTWHYRFGTSVQREEYIEKNIAEAATRLERRREQKAKYAEAMAQFVNPYKVGDILVNTWGYDQTNVDWYAIIAVKPRSVVIIEIGSAAVEDREPGYSPMSDHCIPQPQTVVGKPKLKPVHLYLTSEGRKIYSIPAHFGCMSLWDGKPEYRSWYH